MKLATNPASTGHAATLLKCFRLLPIGISLPGPGRACALAQEGHPCPWNRTQLPEAGRTGTGALIKIVRESRERFKGIRSLPFINPAAWGDRLHGQPATITRRTT